MGTTRNVVAGRLSVEERTVVNGVGQPLKEPCLVVQTPFDVGHPLFAGVAGIDPEKGGYEHHFSGQGDAGQYTGVFWFGQRSAQAVARRAAGLRLLSVEMLKAAKDTTRISLKAGKPALVGQQLQLLPDVQLLPDLRKYAPKE